MGWGFFAVGVIALVVLLGAFRLADREKDRWIDDRGEVAAENAGRLGTGEDQLSYPDAPLIVRHTGWVATGSALAVAVIGTIIVLLASIAAGQRSQPR